MNDSSLPATTPPGVWDNPDDALREQIERNLTTHPIDARLIESVELLRSLAKTLGSTIVSVCPHSRDRALAITALEEVVMRAVQSIAVHQERALQHLNLGGE